MSSINNADSYARITGTSNNDNIYNSGPYSTIIAAAGDDTVDNFAVHVLVNGGEGNDGIYNKGRTYVTVNAGDGDDTITNYGSLIPINGDDGNDYINSAGGSHVTMNGGTGDDTIVSNSQRASVNGGAGDDLIRITGNSTTVRGGKGNDTIIGSDRYTEVFQYARGDGNDVITNYNTNDFIQITSGRVSGASVEGTDFVVFVGNGSLTIKDAVNKQITLMDTNKKISYLNPGDYVRTNIDETVISGTDLPDVINNGYETGGYNSGLHVSISAGGGNDTINNKGNKVYIDGGDDKDKVNNFGSDTTILGAAGDDYIKNQGTYVLVEGGEGDDYINNHFKGNHSTLNGGNGDDRIYNYADYVLVNGGEGDDYIHNAQSGSNSTLNGGAGNDIIKTSTVNDVLVNGGTGDDYIYSGGKNITINGGTGDDTIRCLTGNQIIQYADGDGSDIIYGYNTSDTIQITSGSIKGGQISGTDVLFYIGENVLTLKSAIKQSITILDANGSLTSQFYTPDSFDPDVVNPGKISTINGSDEDDKIYNRNTNTIINSDDGNDYIINYSTAHNTTINGESGNDTIKNSNANDVLITGGSGNDSLYISGSRVTVNGGTGDDTIRTISGNHIIQYAEGDGNDVIYGFNTKDTIQLTSGTITGGLGIGDDILYYIGDEGSLLLKNAINQEIAIADSEGNVTKNKGVYFPDNVTVNSNYTAMTVGSPFSGTVNLNYYKNLKTVTAESDCSVFVIGNDKANVFYAGDVGGTLEGGTANDVLYGGAGSDVLVYNKGDGNDTFYKYDAGDSIQLASDVTVSRVGVSGRNVIFYFDGGGSIKLSDAKGTAITINGNSENTGTYTYTKGTTEGLVETADSVTGGNTNTRTSAFVEKDIADTWFTGEDRVVSDEIDVLLDNKSIDIIHYKLSDDISLEDNSLLQISNNELNKRGVKSNGK